MLGRITNPLPSTLERQMQIRVNNHPDADTPLATISIRRVDGPDDALVGLAALDSSALSDGPWLVAEVEDHPLAAQSLTSGQFVADPFSRSDELRALLELRAYQLRARDGRRRLRAPGASGRPTRARAALAGSPPGAGGRL